MFQFSVKSQSRHFSILPKENVYLATPVYFFFKYCLKTGFRRGFRILFRGMFPQQQIFCSKRILLHFLFEVALYYLRAREVFCHCYFLRSRDFSPSCCDTANNFLLCFSFLTEYHVTFTSFLTCCQTITITNSIIKLNMTQLIQEFYKQNISD